MLWGRNARAAAEAQPQAKRQRLSEDAPATLAAAVVLCTGCHQPARQQTAQRDGPNKGRQFYKCPKPKECKFFQWADEQPAATASSSNSQTSGANNSSNWSSTNARGNSQSETSWGNSNNNTSSWGTQNKSNSQTETSSWGSGNSQENRARGAGGSNSTSWGRSSQQSTENVATNSWNRGNNNSSSGGAGSSSYMRSNSSSTVTITQTKISGNANDVQCNCGSPASSLTVVKDGPNKGRPFFACPTREREKSCGFFQWGDTDENQGELKHNL